jgi:ribonuclease D
MSLSSLVLVTDEQSLDQLASTLALAPVVAVDTESNSLHAYRERVCLIQISTLVADYIVDPIALPDLRALAPVFANPDQQKILHAAENDLVCLRRDFQFEFANVFDTMTAARTLGWPQVGLAAILNTQFGVTMDKKYQRSDWGRRPLSSEQLEYARLDTHYLAALRDKQFDELTSSGRWPEAHEEFQRLARGRDEGDAVGSAPPAFWRVKGARDLLPQQAALLDLLFTYREREAERLDRPPFKVMAEASLMELTRRAPRRQEELRGVPGMSPDQVRRHGEALLHAIEQGLQAPAQYPPREAREPEEVRDRYDRLHTWRKDRARARGVESDVIVPRTTLQDLARRAPRTHDELATIKDFGPWRRGAYGDEILALLTPITQPSEPA